MDATWSVAKTRSQQLAISIGQVDADSAFGDIAPSEFLRPPKKSHGMAQILNEIPRKCQLLGGLANEYATRPV